jgi:hypothetical protein
VLLLEPGTGRGIVAFGPQPASECFFVKRNLSRPLFSGYLHQDFGDREFGFREV